MMSDAYLNDDMSAERREARSWVVRLASGRLTVEDGAAFRRWHASDPAHAHAFAEAKAQWQAIGTAVSDMAASNMTAGRIKAEDGAASRPIARSRRWILGGAAAAAACAGVVAVRPPFGLWTPLVDISSDFHTGIGETRAIAVADDVSVQLSTRSRLALQTGQGHDLRVALLAGEATIASQSRPVTVDAGDVQARAASGRFNLRNDDGIVRVTCLDGVTDVTCASRQIALMAHQQVRYDAQGLSSPVQVDAEDLTAWQRGMLVFRDQMLRDVVAEINRYRRGKIVLLNQSLGERPVAAASFHLDRLDEVVTQIKTLYGARARYLPGGVVSAQLMNCIERHPDCRNVVYEFSKIPFQSLQIGPVLLCRGP